MADMHVLNGGESGTWRIAMHFPIPNTNNAVGVNRRTALINSREGGTTVLEEGIGPGQITAAEKASIEAGAVHEYIAEFRIESGGTAPSDLRASIRQFFSAEKARILAILDSRLRYFGHTETEA